MSFAGHYIQQTILIRFSYPLFVPFVAGVGGSPAGVRDSAASAVGRGSFTLDTGRKGSVVEATVESTAIFLLRTAIGSDAGQRPISLSGRPLSLGSLHYTHNAISEAIV